MLNEAIALGLKFNQPDIVARAHSMLGLAWLAKNDIGRSLDALQQAADLAEATGDWMSTCVALANLSSVYVALRLQSGCREVLQRLEALQVDMGYGANPFLDTLAELYHVLGDLSGARDLLRRAHEQSLKHQDYDLLRQIYATYGVLLINSGEPDCALCGWVTRRSAGCTPGAIGSIKPRRLTHARVI